MRLAEQADETIAAALDAGITVFDTARAYDGNEQLLARALRNANEARIVTKGGMARPNGAWVPDGRAKSIRADCEASLDALGGLPIDLYLLHAPDPRTPWSTSVRALARLVDDGLVARVGVCNVNRTQLDEAVELAPIAAVQVAISPFDDRALRGGVVDRCSELGIAVIAHSPLGGPRRARRLERHEVLTSIARAHDATQAEVALAWLLGLGPNVVAIPGARRPETARSSARAATLRLDPGEHERLAPMRARPSQPKGDGDVLVVMGIPGAGKSRVADEHVARGYLRLNRDERGGSLADIAARARRGARVGVSRGRPRQHVPHARGAEPRRGDGGAPRGPGPLPLARHAARAGAGQPRRAPARSLRVASATGRAEGGGTIGSGPALADPADAHVSRARASGRRRRLRVRRARAVRADARAGTHGCLRRCRRRRVGRLGERARRGRPTRTTSRLRLAAERRAGRPSTTRWLPSRVSSRARSRRPSARTRPVRRSAGAALRFRDSRSRLRAVTTSIRHARSSSARARRTARSRRRWVLVA